MEQRWLNKMQHRILPADVSAQRGTVKAIFHCTDHREDMISTLRLKVPFPLGPAVQKNIFYSCKIYAGV